MEDSDKKIFLKKHFKNLMKNKHYERLYTLVLEKLACDKDYLPYYEVYSIEYLEMGIWPILYCNESYYFN